ncbi:MAG: alcohol dehydrogenase catalytic domain-containing protein [Planctomycetes bacterium]|nr:alcohol dehydrogenase catalytic domain-containing protein [Planctomycetota bacterium]
MSGVGETMRAAVLRGREDVVIETVPAPHAGPGEVVLRVRAALTCGTDAKVFRRGSHAKMLQPPCLFGHEYAGVVYEVGEGVTKFAVGDEVVGANSAPCGACDPCRRGRESLCDDLLFVNGAFAERLLLPARLVERNLYLRPAGLEPAAAAAVEPVACVLKGVELVAPEARETVLLLGSGSIALFFASELRSRGVDVALLARCADVEPLARRMGVGDVIVAESVTDGFDAIRARSPGGRGFDVVVEAAGAAETTEAAPRLARKGGRVLLFGGCASDVRVTIDPARLHYEEIQILSSFHHTPRHVKAALDALAGGRIDPRPVMESPVGLDALPSALRRMITRELRGKVPVIPL